MRTTLTLAAALLLAPVLVADDVEHAFKTSVPRGNVKRVVIDIPFGSFDVRNGAANTLSLSGVASRDYDGHNERIWAQRVVDDTSVEIYVSGSDAIIRRKFGRNASSWRARKFTGIELRVDLPPGVDVEFETSAGEIELAGTFGNIDIDLRAGEVEIRVPRSTVRELRASCRIGEVRTNLGTEVVTREGILPGRTKYYNSAGKSHVDVHTTVGEVDVTLTQ